MYFMCSMRRFSHHHVAARLASFALPVAFACAAYSWGSAARASVVGSQGIEIEGPRDRRGFYIGPGLGFGVTAFGTDPFADVRFDLALGGGVTKNFTLGVDLHFTPYLAAGVGVGFGGDIEATGYVWRGMYVRGALGGVGIPRTADDDGFGGGLGGVIGVGYEFFLNQTAALGIGLNYELRWIPGDSLPLQGGFVGARITWY